MNSNVLAKLNQYNIKESKQAFFVLLKNKELPKKFTEILFF